MNTFSKVTYSLLFLFVTISNAQKTTILGVVTDSIYQPISRASVVASYDEDETTILAYTTTNDDGTFILNFNRDTADKILWLSYRHINYVTQRLKVENISQEVKILLGAKINNLDEIILRAKKKVEIKGDTITYNTEALTKEKDYSIEDVIGRIPGVKIAENGQISYNERIISHFYINGVDLLEGRYNVATRGIPAEAVEEIDILRKHNHARIDKGVTDSEDVAFNLKIKKDHSLFFGSGKSDIGLPLITHNVELTPIYLGEKIQDIASAKTNNFGKSLENNGLTLTSGNRDFKNLELSSITILSAPNTNGSSISDKYWLDNKSTSFTNDILIKSGKDLVLKAGANFNTNNNEIVRNSTQVYFFGQDSTVVKNEVKNELKRNDFYVGLVQEINKDKFYLKNKFSLEGNTSEGFSNIIQNENLLDYKYDSNSKVVTNKTEFKTKIKNSILNNGLLVNYVKNKEVTEVIPSVFNTQIPNGNNAEQTNQKIHTDQFSLGGYSAYNFTIGKIKSELKQVINWSSELLTSNLEQLPNLTSGQSQFPFVSDFKLNTVESTTSFNNLINFQRFSITFSPKIQYIYLDKQEVLSPALNLKDSYLFFEPKTTFRYKIDYQWNVSLMGNYSSSVSNFNELYNGAILKNYSNLYRNPDEINVTRNTLGILSVAYTNILKGFLFSNSASINNSTSDFIFSSTIDSNGLVQTEAFNLPNNRTNFRNTTNITKSFFRILKTDLTYKFNQVKLNQIFNSTFQETKITNHIINIGLGIDNNTWYGFKYVGEASFGNSKSNGFNAKNTFSKHNLELDFYISSKTRLNLGTESVFTSFSSSTESNKNTLFNSEFFYKPSKKIFFRASFMNIFNEQFFTTVQSSSNFISTSQFSLRSRQFTVGLNFSF